MSQKDDIAIKVTHVSKSFKLPHEKNTSVKSIVLNPFQRRTYEKQEALKEISFEIKKGEFFGIVGRNGSGKSTLLKLLAGIYSPDSGSIEIKGKLTPFIELGVGFNPELTGRENVFLNGALLGFNRKEVLEMYDEIVEFAELERFMDQKLKNYSSGMQVRLAFSIAIRAKSEILLIDEVLAVGDASFQKKCFEVFRDLKKEGRTIILVTHDMANVERFCDRALVLHDGNQLSVSKPSEVTALYARLNIDSNKSIEVSNQSRWGYGGVRVDKVTMHQGTKITKIFNTGGVMSLRIAIKRDVGYEKTPVVCGIAIHNQDGVNISGPNSAQSFIPPGNKRFEFVLKDIPLTSGEYKLTIALYDDSLTTPFDVLDKWETFSIVSDHTVHGAVELKGTWKS